MNKAKLLYDVTRILKNKERIDGVLTTFIQKDQEEIFSLRNQFAKSGDQAITDVSCELNIEGKKVKRESHTEFSGSGPCCHGDRLRRFFHHRHGTEGGNCIKGFFSRLSLLFGLFGAVKAEERDGGSILISLNLADLPEELKTEVRERLNGRCCCEEQGDNPRTAHHGHHGHHWHHVFADGPHSVESFDGLLLVTLNSKREIEKISLHLDGRVLNQKEESHAVTATADVQFAW